MHSEENMISCATILLLSFYFLLVPGRLHSVVILNETKAPKGFTPHSLSRFLELHIYTPPCDFKDLKKKKKRCLPDDSAPSMESKERRKLVYETSSLGHLSLMLLSMPSKVSW